MTCNCCGTNIPNFAKTLLCPPCMKALVLHSPRRIRCKIHGNIVDPEESQKT